MFNYFNKSGKWLLSVFLNNYKLKETLKKENNRRQKMLGQCDFDQNEMFINSKVIE